MTRNLGWGHSRFTSMSLSSLISRIRSVRRPPRWVQGCADQALVDGPRHHCSPTTESGGLRPFPYSNLTAPHPVSEDFCHSVRQFIGRQQRVVRFGEVWGRGPRAFRLWATTLFTRSLFGVSSLALVVDVHPLFASSLRFTFFSSEQGRAYGECTRHGLGPRRVPR